MELKIKKLSPNAVIPKNATSGSAGMDLYACIDEDIVIEPGKRVLVPTGLAIALESADYVAYIFARSGLAVKSGITLTNCVGYICIHGINCGDVYDTRYNDRENK